MDHYHTVAITVLLMVIGIAFVLTCVFMTGCLHHLHGYRRELGARVKALRIHRMLERRGVRLPRYLRKARSIDIEKHLLSCEYCQAVEVCDSYLARNENVDAGTFCPNSRELERYRSR